MSGPEFKTALSHFTEKLATPPGMTEVNLPRGARILKPDEKHYTVGAVKLFHGSVRTFEPDHEYTDGSLIMYKLWNERVPIQVYVGHQVLDGEKINEIGSITEGLMNNQRQVEVISGLFSDRRGSAFEDSSYMGTTVYLQKAQEGILAQRANLVQKANTLGVTLIQNPRMDGFINVRDASAESKGAVDHADSDQELAKLPKDLNIDPADQPRIMERMATIMRIFDSLFIPQKLGTLTRFRPLRYGEHFLFGRNRGQPRSVHENKSAAIYEREEAGIEMWRVLKSRALTAPGYPLMMVHLRADMDVDIKALAGRLHVKPEEIVKAKLDEGEYGTVNPLAKADYHIFDQDMIDGNGYLPDDLVLTSSGEPEVYLAFKAKDYLTALSGTDTKFDVMPIGMPSPGEPERKVARRAIIVIGGDSSQDTADLQQAIAGATIEKLKVIIQRWNEKKKKMESVSQFFGDRSVPNIEAVSDRKLSGSINTHIHHRQLLAHVVSEIIPRLASHEDAGTAYADHYKPIVLFSSTAMDGVAGARMQQERGFEYLGRGKAVQHLLHAIEAEGVKPTYTVLLGLPSVYDREISAFKDILGQVLPVNGDKQAIIQKFIEKCKKEPATKEDITNFYNTTVAEIVTAAAKQNEIDLESANIAVIWGASELETTLENNTELPKQFVQIKSTDPASIAAEIAKLDEPLPELENPTKGEAEARQQAEIIRRKMRFIGISPRRVLIDEATTKTFEKAPTV